MKITGYLHFVYQHTLTHLENETKTFFFYFFIETMQLLGLQPFSSTNSISFHVKHKFLNSLLFSPDNFSHKMPRNVAIRFLKYIQFIFPMMIGFASFVLSFRLFFLLCFQHYSSLLGTIYANFFFLFFTFYFRVQWNSFFFF